MTEIKPRLARLSTIITQLQSKKIVTAKSLAERHNVSIRTIYRDIRTLEKSGIPIITEEGRGYSIMEDYYLPPVMFTEAEAMALITAEQLILKNKDKSLSESYQSAIIKTKAVLKNRQKEKTELVESRLQIRDNPKVEKTSAYLIQLQLNIANFQLVELHYANVSGYESQRKVEPFAVFTTKGNWILVAFCRNSNEFRAFRLDRIQNLIITDKTFEPHNITLEQYLEECRKKWEKTPDIPLSQAPSNFAGNKNIIMQNLKIEPFKVIGIKVKTTNQNEQALQDIGALWNKFLSEGIASKIPNKIEETIFSIYTNYEGDHTQPYDTILGCKVSCLDIIPNGMIGQSFEGGNYCKFICNGDLTKGAVYESWLKIWKEDLDRLYTADFELYGEKAQDPSNAEVEIYIAIK